MEEAMGSLSKLMQVSKHSPASLQDSLGFHGQHSVDLSQVPQQIASVFTGQPGQFATRPSPFDPGEQTGRSENVPRSSQLDEQHTGADRIKLVTVRTFLTTQLVRLAGDMSPVVTTGGMCLHRERESTTNWEPPKTPLAGCSNVRIQ